MSAPLSDLTKRDKEFMAHMDETARREWIRAIVDRMMMAWGQRNKTELSRALGLNDNAASMWIQNRSVPWSAIFLCAFKTGKSLDWLYFGHDPICLLSQSNQKKLKAKLLAGLNLSCEARQISQANANGIETLSIALTEEVTTFISQHGEVGHLPMTDKND